MNSYVRKNIAKMAGYTPGEQPVDRQIIKLNTNENPYAPSPAVGRALEDFDFTNLGLYPDPVCSKLRGMIADYHGCDAGCVLVGNGSDELLALCIRAFVEAKGKVGYFEPSYSLYPVLADMHGLRKTAVPLGPDFEWAMPDEVDASLFFLANPNAPTGIMYPLEQVRHFCERFSGVVVIDEAYADFAEANCMSLALELENVIALRTFSKSFSLAGLRLGYAVGPVDLIGALYKLKDSYNVDRIAQALGCAAFSDIEYMRSNSESIKTIRRHTAAALAKRGFKVYPSQTNFLWVEPAGIEASVLFEKLRGEKILVRYFPGPRTGKCLRISMGTREQMDKLAQAVDRILKQP
ncbi:MAG: histidinol-phosphate transaminase [Kiritimatiellia bacterium]